MLLSDIVLGRSTGRGAVFVYAAASSPSLCEHGGVVFFTSPGRYAWEDFDKSENGMAGKMSPGLGCYSWRSVVEKLRDSWDRPSLLLSDVIVSHHCSSQICNCCGEIFAAELLLVVELLPMSLSRLSPAVRMGHG
jgi:hypothetical protein